MESSIASTAGEPGEAGASVASLAKPRSKVFHEVERSLCQLGQKWVPVLRKFQSAFMP
ncbi:hypothetical protein [Corynebacterium yonathiae]|uniref:Uncharacterized protein n=1 Tax=Corynebacterium yonathiae TaxID=2913504 RepID=A0A9X3RND9_9CORY|nr:MULTISPECIES: hypothetical protein [Corynebacterium]MCZ9295773.1 hypothetical protein [Corynebacterium yonathiae]MDK2582377.1 hypothetical protein [Corynebacterium sp. BWA136]